MQRSGHKHKRVHLPQRTERKWFVGSRTAVVIAAILITALAFGEIYLQLLGPRAGPVSGWIIDGSQLQDLAAFLPSSLPKKYFGARNAVVLKDFTTPSNPIPDGWRSQAGNHYTSVTAHDCGSGCTSLQRDAASGSLNARPKPVVLYDDEHWTRTPVAEQTSPCHAMDEFVQTAQRHGLTTILAPDQDLAQPGVITDYKGGESENWQTYLRLGLASCAAQTGSQWYHIMSQPFEAHWCGNLFGQCQSSESDFVNFVTQAALQARAVKPDIKLSDGLSTNPQYFGYFRGSQTLATIMYRDYFDVRHVVNSVWLNVVGRNADTTALYFLSMLGKRAGTIARSSVLFLRPDNVLRDVQPTAPSAGTFGLGAKGSTITFASTQTLSGGTSLPAGTGEFQFWTDGTTSESANISVQFGYCAGPYCIHHVALKNLNLHVHGGARGTVLPDGAFTTSSDTILPQNDAYHLYITLTAEGGSNFNLLYGSKNAATNLATPVLVPVE